MGHISDAAWVAVGSGVILVATRFVIGPAVAAASDVPSFGRAEVKTVIPAAFSG